jgi:hypothetical protein
MKLEMYPRIFDFLLILNLISYFQIANHRHQPHMILVLHITVPDKIGFPLHYRALGPHFFHNMKSRLNLVKRHSH